MPLRTWSMSAPTFSHRFANWFISVMRAASIAFAAYLVISAEGMSMNSIGLPCRTNGEYSSRSIASASGPSTPITTRSGLRKSWTAAPSFRNSGFDAT